MFSHPPEIVGIEQLHRDTSERVESHNCSRERCVPLRQEHQEYRLLDYAIYRGWDAKLAYPTITFVNLHAMYRLGSIRYPKKLVDEPVVVMLETPSRAYRLKQSLCHWRQLVLLLLRSLCGRRSTPWTCQLCRAFTVRGHHVQHCPFTSIKLDIPQVGKQAC
ncbi:hypothetical protein HG15A2_09120 [Adhaeretor mobilis]|uniref:Uncharacterized protein n=2 Tax=Adhaeretor mobilis TaxID=1930276 RepID=A0A517MRY5_9BACT|nr:hypothetical protein HG15A2_09120 [Adhaeretor mobilis]